MKWRIAVPGMIIAIGFLLEGCAGGSSTLGSQADVRAYLKTLVYCENHYPALKDTAQCQAAFRKNEEMFPGWYP